MNRHIYFLCGAKDFHAMDKFRLTADAVGVDNITLITDTFEGEGQQCLVRPEYRVKPLLVIDRFTLARPSYLADIWRNIVKLAFLPLQTLRLRRLRGEVSQAVVHAVPIYYMVLCWLAGIRFVGTPQGSEVLVRPGRSWAYRFFARRALRSAATVIVDSNAMRDAVRLLADREAMVVKNGFDTAAALAAQAAAQTANEPRVRVVSMRGCQPLYRLHRIVAARDAARVQPAIDFAYPAFAGNYLAAVRSRARPDDAFHGMLPREQLYRMFARALLAVSIPTSDSSPRSVYEAIFCGAIVALTAEGFYDELPACMRARVCLVDLDDPQWFDKAIEFARERSQTPYAPSPEALALCDQQALIRRIVAEVYGLRGAAPAESGG